MVRGLLNRAWVLVRVTVMCEGHGDRWLKGGIFDFADGAVPWNNVGDQVGVCQPGTPDTRRWNELFLFYERVSSLWSTGRGMS